MISKKFLSLTNITKTQTFYIYKFTEAIVARKHKDLIFTIFEIVLPDFKSFNNYQKFIVISFILNFG